MAASYSVLLRTATPKVCIPATVRVSADMAWRSSGRRLNALREMRFVLAHQQDADLQTAAYDYLRYQAWRAQVRWKPTVLTTQRVDGLQHLAAARAARGVVIAFMHHGGYTGAFASIARHGFADIDIILKPSVVDPHASRTQRQNHRVYATRTRTHSVAIGSGAIKELLRGGRMVALATDVPGHTPTTFAGHQVIGSSGAARLAIETESAVVVATSHLEPDGNTSVKLHEPLNPTGRDPSRLLRTINEIHENAILLWPGGYHEPTRRWQNV